MSHPTTNASGGFFTKPYGSSSAGQSSSSPSTFLPPQSPSSSSSSHSGDHSLTIAAARRRNHNDDEGGDNLYSGHRTFPDQPNWKTDMQKQNREDEKDADADGYVIGSERYSGTVKWYDPQRNYGFITCDSDGEDIFVHRSVIQGRNKNLFGGQKVEYSKATATDGQSEAESVTLV